MALDLVEKDVGQALLYEGHDQGSREPLVGSSRVRFDGNIPDEEQAHPQQPAPTSLRRADARSDSFPPPVTLKSNGITRCLNVRGTRFGCSMVGWTVLVALSCVLILWVAVSELSREDD
ncbi:hypothetical protein BJY04DRAFT_220345 [Aspergillus karnatakaensis]|uniref:uncharacterized protein n=1 Tax=Aspergillus karnatakaensis TaxID=1810916 RepID=UPI003CCE360E